MSKSAAQLDAEFHGVPQQMLSYVQVPQGSCKCRPLIRRRTGKCFSYADKSKVKRLRIRRNIQDLPEDELQLGHTVFRPECNTTTAAHTVGSCCSFSSPRNVTKSWPNSSSCTCAPTLCFCPAASNLKTFSEFNTSCLSSMLCSQGWKTTLPHLTPAVTSSSSSTQYSSSSHTSTLASGTRHTTPTAMMYNLWHQLFASLVWHITASAAISVLVTFCWIMAYSQGVLALAPAATEVGPGASTSTEEFYRVTSLITTTTRLPLSTGSLILTTNVTASTTTKSQRFNRDSIIRSRNDINFNYNIVTDNRVANIFANKSDSMIQNMKDLNATEITFLNDISLSTAAISATTNPPASFASIYDYDTSAFTTTAAANDNDMAVMVMGGVVAYNDSLDARNINQTSGGQREIAVTNGSGAFDAISAEDATEYVFDRTDVRIIFITLYTMVFCCCFFGNLLVILVVTLSRRLRSITNFFLANLALADFCVGLFCVMQNLSIYLIDSWVFGEFLCRMYQFVHSLSYTASIFILVVICMERYFAIVHPITCKQILTAARLRMVILTVWITSAVYSTPKFVFSKTIKNVHTESGQEEEICVLDRKMFNSKLLDMINFVLLYVIPLLVMTILYSKIAIALWRSSRGLSHHLAQQENSMGLHNSMYHHQHHHHNNHVHNNHHLHHNHHQLQPATTPQSHQALGTPISMNSSVGSGGSTSLSRKQSSKYEKRGVNITESQVSLDADRPVVSACRKTSFYQHNHLAHHQPGQAPMGNHHHRPHLMHNHSGSGASSSGGGGSGLHGSQRVSHFSHSSNNVLRARRGVVRMLIIFVLTFALCNLPYHARKMWQYWSRSYRGDSNFNALLTPLTFLVTYFNSGINPLLYAFLSRNFRKGMKELLMCSWRKSKTKSSTNSSMHHKRMTLQTHSLPTDTTHIGNEQL